MGEYADMAIEQGFNDYIDSIDSYYGDDFYDDDPYGVYSNRCRSKKKKNQLPIIEFNVGENVQVLKTGVFDFNHICLIKAKTEKAILFKINTDWDCEKDADKDFCFWLPKSVLYMEEGEKRVYRVKEWAIIKNIL